MVRFTLPIYQPHFANCDIQQHFSLHFSEKTPSSFCHSGERPPAPVLVSEVGGQVSSDLILLRYIFLIHSPSISLPCHSFTHSPSSTITHFTISLFHISKCLFRNVSGNSWERNVKRQSCVQRLSFKPTHVVAKLDAIYVIVNTQSQ